MKTNYMASTTSKSYLSIKPGETKVLKKSAKILSVINYGNVSFTNTCADFTNLIENASCYNLIWGMSGDDNEAIDRDAIIEYISILGVKYSIGRSIHDEISGGVISHTDDRPDDNGLTIFLQGLIPQSIMKIYNITVDIPDNLGRAQFTMNFQTTPTVADTIEMYLTGNAYANGLYVKPVLSAGNCGESGQS